MTQEDRKSILQMAQGAIMERVDYEMSRVLDNILDPNTSATAKRKLTVTLTFTPDDERVELPFEEMQIALRTRFQDTTDTPYVQKLLSDISTGAKITYNDSGVATTVVTKKGIDLQANETIKPIITLRPYRTFQEVEQPESVFLIRINERGISFIEADGGMWKLHARETIKHYLEWKLKDEIENGAVVVAL